MISPIDKNPGAELLAIFHTVARCYFQGYSSSIRDSDKLLTHTLRRVLLDPLSVASTQDDAERRMESTAENFMLD